MDNLEKVESSQDKEKAKKRYAGTFFYPFDNIVDIKPKVAEVIGGLVTEVQKVTFYRSCSI